MLPLYAALTVVLHLEVPSFPMVLLPSIFPKEDITSMIKLSELTWYDWTNWTRTYPW